MVEERCLGTHLVIPVVLRVIGALIILKESGIKATRLITSCHRDVEELFFGGQVFYRELRCQLRKVKLAIISILKITQCRSPGSSAIGLIVNVGRTEILFIAVAEEEGTHHPLITTIACRFQGQFFTKDILTHTLFHPIEILRRKILVDTHLIIYILIGSLTIQAKSVARIAGIQTNRSCSGCS